jgi:hypothetical protein
MAHHPRRVQALTAGRSDKVRLTRHWVGPGGARLASPHPTAGPQRALRMKLQILVSLVVYQLREPIAPDVSPA